MKRSTLALVVAFGAVLAYYLLVERHAKPPEEAAREAKRLFPVKEDQVRTLHITQPSGSVRLERLEGGAWRMTEPVRARADRWACAAVVTALTQLEQVRSIHNDAGAKGLEEMGLARPRVRIEVGVAAPEIAPGHARTEGRTVLELGDDVPATSSAFLRIDGISGISGISGLPGKDEVYLVPASAAAALLKPPQEFRDRALLDLTVLDIGEARLKRPEGELLFKRRADEWWVERPFVDLAEGSAVQSLLSSLISLRAESFLDETPAPSSQAASSKIAPGTGGSAGPVASTTPPPAGGAPARTAGTPAGAAGPAARGLDPPSLTVHLASAAGGTLADLALGSAIAGQEGKRYARVVTPGAEQVDAIVSLRDTTLTQPDAAYRAKKALPFHTWDVTGLNLISPSITLSFSKTDAGWNASSPPGLKLDPEAVEQTLRALADLEVASYDGVAGGSRAGLGLGPPAARIELAFAAPAKTKTLDFGTAGSIAGTVYALSSARPGLLEVPASILDRIRRGADLYAQKPVATPKADGAAPAGPSVPGAGEAGHH